MNNQEEIEGTLKERLKFEILISEFSAALINMPADDLESELESWLKRFSEFLGVDRVSIYQLVGNKSQLKLVRSYAAPGINPVPADYQPKSSSAISELLLYGEVIKCERIPDDLPKKILDRKDLNQEPFMKYGTKSLIAMPLEAEGSIVGAAVFTTFRTQRSWSDSLVRRFKLLGEVIANALVRKHAQKELLKEMTRRRRLEERNTTIQKSTAVGFCITDTEENIKEVNEAYCRMVGYSREELLSMRIGDLDIIFNREQLKQNLQRLKQEGTLNHETRYRCKDGTIIELEINTTIMPLEERVFIFFRDVTELKRAERELDIRLRFESLVSGFSSALINLSPEDLENELKIWLKRFTEFLGVDHAGISEFSEDLTSFHVIQSYNAPRVYHVPADYMPNPHSPLIRQLLRGEIVRWERIPDDLPKDADPSLINILKTRPKSLLGIPIKAGGIIRGAILFASFRAERQWPDDVIQRVGLIGEITANYLLRRYTELELEERLNFETLLSDFSAALIKHPSEDLETVLQVWLKRFTEFLGVNCAAVSEFSDDKSSVTLLQAYFAPGIPEPGVDRIPDMDSPVIQQLLQGNIVNLSRVSEDLPEGTDLNKLKIVKTGTTSLLSVPLEVKDDILGYMVFATIRSERTWSEESVRRIRLLGEIVANTIMHRRQQTALMDEMTQRKRLEERNAMILKTTMVGFWIIDNEGNIQEVNDAYCHMVGYSREELLSMNLTDLVVLKPGEIERNLKRIRDRISHGFETRHRCKDGAIVDLEVNATYMPDEGGIFTFFRDITDLKRAQQELEDRLTFEELISGFSADLINLPAKDFEGTLALWQKRIVEFLNVDHAAITEFSKDKIPFVTIQPYTVPGVKPPPMDPSPKPPVPIKDQLLNGHVVKFERMPDDIPEEIDAPKLRSVRDRTKSFLAIPLMAKGSVIGAIIFATFREYRQWPENVIRQLRLLGEMIANSLLRIRTERELEDRLKFEAVISEFSAALINMPSRNFGDELGVWLKRFVEFLDVDLCAVSEYLENKTKYYQIQSYINPQIHLKPVDQEIKPTHDFFNRLRQGEVIRLERIHDDLPEGIDSDDLHIVKDGTKSLLAIPLEAGGECIGSLVFATFREEKKWSDSIVRRLRLVGEIIANALVRNTTEKELAEYRGHLENLVEERTEKLRLAQEELVQSERLAILGKLTATVSHELRNPLGTIRTSLFSVGQRLKGHGFKVEKAIERAERNINRCDNIIEELLDFTRVRELDLEATEIDAWVSELLDNVEVPKGITLEKKLQSGIQRKMDRERFRRCLINILTNAFQAVEQLDDKERDSRVEVWTKIEGDLLVIKIDDNGVGVDSKDLERIFEPLYSTKSFGVGLGIPISKQVVEQHGGSMQIENKPGRGTTVILNLPLTIGGQD